MSNKVSSLLALHLKVLFISCTCLFANLVQAQTFRLTCTVLKANSGVAAGFKANYIVDSEAKLIKPDCEDCPWNDTLYWGDDYIVLTNSSKNRSFGNNHGFVQSTLTVINLETMLRYGVLIDDNLFNFYEMLKDQESYDGVPNFSISRCSRSFN